MGASLDERASAAAHKAAREDVALLIEKFGVDCAGQSTQGRQQLIARMYPVSLSEGNLTLGVLPLVINNHWA